MQPPLDAPFSHTTGTGYVAPYRGQYDDALNNGREVWVLLAEVTGALDETTAALLRKLATRAATKGMPDRTAYGRTRAATRDFFTHHTRALSLAIATAVGEAIRPRMPALSKAVCLADRPPLALRRYSGTPRGTYTRMVLSLLVRSS